MATIEDPKQQYHALDRTIPIKGEEAIDTQCLLAFQYD